MAQEIAGSLEIDTRYLWTAMRNLKSAVDNGDTEGVSEYREAVELVSCQSDNAAIRMTASRALAYIRPVQAPEPPPTLAFVSGAAALLEAFTRKPSGPPEPEAPLPLVAAAGD